MLRCPYTHLVFDDPHRYRMHLETIIREDHTDGLPRQTARRLRREFLALRAAFHKAGHTFKDIETFINVNSEAIMRAPILGKHALKNSKGFVFKLDKEFEPRWRQHLVFNNNHYGFAEYTQPQEGPGWEVRGHIDVPQGIMWANHYAAALSAIGVCVTDYSFDSRGRSKRLQERARARGEPATEAPMANRYFIEFMLFANDWAVLLLLEKMHERAFERPDEVD